MDIVYDMTPSLSQGEYVEDKYGAAYSNDGSKLLRAPHNLTRYTIKHGTKVIGHAAFCAKTLSKFLFPILL